MGKIIATFKYGDLRTRLYLGAVLILLVLGVAGIITGLIASEFLITAGGILLILLSAVVFVMGHFSSEAVDTEDDGRPIEKTAELQVEKATEISSEKVSETKAEKPSELRDGIKTEKNEEKELEIRAEKKLEIKKEKKLEIKKEKKLEKKIEKEKVTASRKFRKEKKEKDTEEEKTAKKIEDEKIEKSENARARDWQYRYTPDTLKTITKRYKVKRKFVPIIIDNCDIHAVSRTPALMWVKGSKVSFLLLEQNERVISLPMEKFLKVTYDHNVPERRMSDYEDIKNKLGVYEKFEDVMPTFSRGTDRMGSAVYTKNLYVLGGEIEITAKSFKKLKGMYDFSVNLFDSLNLKGEYSHYFKRAYENRLLWTDTVISQAEYQTSMRGILETMVRDKTIDRFDMDDDLDLMIRYRLITDEYAKFYRSRK